MISESNFETAIRGWLDATTDRQIPTGLSVEEATLRASEWLAKLPAADDEAIGGELGPKLADVLYAVCQVLESSEFDLEKIELAYDLVARRQWAEDEFCERDLLLSRLAYLGWRGCRLQGKFVSMKIWQNKSVERVMAQAIVRNFLAIPCQNRSAELTLRFLKDPAVALTVSSRLAILRNISPAIAAKEAAIAYTCLLEADDGITLECRNHLAAELAFSVSVATRHLGRYSESMAWALRAERLLAQTGSGDAFRAQVDFQRLCIAYERYDLRLVIDDAPALIASLKKKDPTDQLGRCQLLEALAFKDGGFLEKAFARLESLRKSTDCETDRLLLGLVLANLGETVAGMGDYAAAMEYLGNAIELLRVANVPFAIANFQGALGEVLRDHGKLAEAVKAYRAGIAIYDDLEMSGRAAYLRVILAETLIAAGRESEATTEILEALPIIKREHLMPSALAGLTLLQESLRRQKVDPQALRQLRQHLSRFVGRRPA